MSMFNVTRHGVDNCFHWSTTQPPISLKEQSDHETNRFDVRSARASAVAGDEADGRMSPTAVRTKSAASGCTLPPIPNRYPPLTTLVQGNTAALPRRFESHPPHDGSHQKYMEIRTKHRRDVKGPNEHYRNTVVTSHDYGRWMQTCPLGQEPWTSVHRRPLVNSEMTRFVDEMTLTNKDFSLF